MMGEKVMSGRLLEIQLQQLKYHENERGEKERKEENGRGERLKKAHCSRT